MGVTRVHRGAALLNTLQRPGRPRSSQPASALPVMVPGRPGVHSGARCTPAVQIMELGHAVGPRAGSQPGGAAAGTAGQASAVRAACA